MAAYRTIDRLADYLRRRFEIEPRGDMDVDRPHHVVKLAATFQAVEIDLREIVELVMREEALAKPRFDVTLRGRLRLTDTSGRFRRQANFLGDHAGVIERQPGAIVMEHGTLTMREPENDQSSSWRRIMAYLRRGPPPPAKSASAASSPEA
jgi:hypothetical protein